MLILLLDSTTTLSHLHIW